VPDHVLTDTSLTDMDTELERFPVNMWRSPQWIFAAQHADQLANSVGSAGRPGLLRSESSSSRIGQNPYGASR